MAPPVRGRHVQRRTLTCRATDTLLNGLVNVERHLGWVSTSLLLPADPHLLFTLAGRGVGEWIPIITLMYSPIVLPIYLLLTDPPQHQ